MLLSLFITKGKIIFLTGGEPFVRKDFDKVTKNNINQPPPKNAYYRPGPLNCGLIFQDQQAG